VSWFGVRQAWQAQIVTGKDREYAWYAGASWKIAEKMAVIDALLKYNLIPEKAVPLVKLYRAYLDQQRKAWLPSVGLDNYN
jgi:alpha-D-ribose 1-methylphosphonate 5-triphosphate synthase subunit PhnG